MGAARVSECVQGRWGGGSTHAPRLSYCQTLNTRPIDTHLRHTTRNTHAPPAARPCFSSDSHLILFPTACSTTTRTRPVRACACGAAASSTDRGSVTVYWIFVSRPRRSDRHAGRRSDRHAGRRRDWPPSRSAPPPARPPRALPPARYTRTGWRFGATRECSSSTEPPANSGSLGRWLDFPLPRRWRR